MGEQADRGQSARRVGVTIRGDLTGSGQECAYLFERARAVAVLRQFLEERPEADPCPAETFRQAVERREPAGGRGGAFESAQDTQGRGRLDGIVPRPDQAGEVVDEGQLPRLEIVVGTEVSEHGVEELARALGHGAGDGQANPRVIGPGKGDLRERIELPVVVPGAEGQGDPVSDPGIGVLAERGDLPANLGGRGHPWLGQWNRLFANPRMGMLEQIQHEVVPEFPVGIQQPGGLNPGKGVFGGANEGFKSLFRQGFDVLAEEPLGRDTVPGVRMAQQRDEIVPGCLD